MENNKLIAEFMGMKQTSPNGCFRLENDPKGIFTYLSFECEGYTHLQYNTSWDWLMPVVEKIESLKKTIHSIDVQITIDRVAVLVNATPLYMDIRQWSKKSKIESVYSACIVFIEWYNENK